MTAIAKRKTRLSFETEGRIRGRAIVIECGPWSATVRLKGTRQRLGVSWESIYYRAAEIEADRIRRERLARRKAKKGGVK